VNPGVAVYAIEANGPLVWELLLSSAKRYAALWAGENHYRFCPSGHRTRTISAALMCGTCAMVSWMRWVSIVAPHGHLIKELGFCDGILSPPSHIAYFRAVQSRSSRPENRPRSISTTTAAKRAQSRRALGRRSPPCRPHARPDGSRDRSCKISPMGLRLRECRCG
jgi:hypothetical protein